MKYEEIIRDLKNKVYHPIYFLKGEEPYFIDNIANYIADNLLSDSEKEFNQTVIYGRDTNADELISIAKRYPMMANYQVLIVKEAQHVKDIEKLDSYFSKPQPSTIMVICYKYKKIDGRKAFGKSLSTKTVVFTSELIRDYKIPDFINNMLKVHHLTITPTGAKMLTDFLGADLTKISNELDKLAIVVPANSEITPAIIEKNIGISKDYNIFELQNAVGKKQIVKANEIAFYFANNKKNHPMVVTIAALYSFFSKLILYYGLSDKSERNVAAELKIHPYFVKDYTLAARHYSLKKLVAIVGYLRDYDKKTKGVNNTSVPEGELLRELLFKIMH